MQRALALGSHQDVLTVDWFCYLAYLTCPFCMSSGTEIAGLKAILSIAIESSWQEAPAGSCIGRDSNHVLFVFSTGILFL